MAEKKKSGRGQGAKTTAKRKPLVKTKKTPEKKLKKKASSGDYVVDYHTAQAEKKEKAARGSKPSSGAAFLARNARKTADKAIEQRREKDEKLAKKSEAKPKPKAKAKPAAKEAEEKTVQRIKASKPAPKKAKPAPKKAKPAAKKAKAPAKKKEPSSFGKAFSKAHDSGADTFMWKGELKNTKRADGSETKARKAAKAKASKPAPKKAKTAPKKAKTAPKEVTPSKKAPGTKRERTSPRKPQM